MSNVLRGVITNPDKIYGKSAYEIAVMHGFDGTEEEWVKATDLAKEITLDCSTKAQYYAGLAETANENAGMHETDARESAREAQAHLQEVRNIVDAAGEKLDLLANIPDDYITLDADVKSNTALIAGNKADIASNERAIAKNAENITRNSKRITNIEQGLTPDSFETDDSVAYQKDVPANALPYAAVQKVGGMTRKCANLFNFELWKATAATDRANVTYGDNSVTVSAIEGDAFIISEAARVMVKGGETYTISFVESNTAIESVHYLFKNGKIDNSMKVFYGSPYTFVADADAEYYTVRFGVSNAGSTITFSNIMLNEGEPKPYEPYFEGLRSAKVTEVESVGANLLDSLKVSSTNINGIVIEYLKDEDCFLINGTATHTAMRSHTEVNIPIKKQTLYRITHSYVSGTVTRPSGTGYALTYIGYNRTGTTNPNWFSCDLNMSDSAASGNSSDATTLTHFWFYIDAGVTFNNYKVRVMIYEGDALLPYRPYTKRTLPIPEAVRPANGINENVYNYIDWEKRQFVKRVGVKVFNGTEGLNDYIANFNEITTDSPLPHVPWSLFTSHGGIGSANKYSFTFNITIFNVKNVDEMAAYLAQQYANGTPVTVHYELLEPIVTDISDLITADNLIGVEGGGTLTFENEYGYAVPSEVEYQVEV